MMRHWAIASRDGLGIGVALAKAFLLAWSRHITEQLELPIPHICLSHKLQLPVAQLVDLKPLRVAPKSSSSTPKTAESRLSEV